MVLNFKKNTLYMHKIPLITLSNLKKEKKHLIHNRMPNVI